MYCKGIYNSICNAFFFAIANAIKKDLVLLLLWKAILKIGGDLGKVGVLVLADSTKYFIIQ